MTLVTLDAMLQGQCLATSSYLRQEIWGQKALAQQIAGEIVEDCRIQGSYCLQTSINEIQAKIQAEQNLGFVAGKCIRAFVFKVGENIPKELCKKIQKLDLRFIKSAMNYMVNMSVWMQNQNLDHRYCAAAAAQKELQEIRRDERLIERESPSAFNRINQMWSFTDY